MSEAGRHQERDRDLAELREELRRYQSAVNELQLLNEIAVTAASSSDVEQTLNRIVRRAIAAFGAEQGSIHLLTEDDGKQFRTLVRQDDQSRLERHFTVDAGVTGWVLAHEEPLLVTDLATDERFRSSPEEQQSIRSLLCAPVWFEGKIIGLITMINRKDGAVFTGDDLTLLSIIAVQAGQLIKSAEFREESSRRLREADAARWEADKLQELDRLKSALFTNIAHELRTPLTLILGPLEHLLAGTQQGDPRRHFRVMHRQAERLLGRVNDLLSLATIDAGVMTLAVGPCDLARLAKRAAASFESAAGDGKVRLTVTSSLDPPVVFCDADKIETVLTNLLSNALKHTPPGGEVRMELAAAATRPSDPVMAELRVVDTGRGIPAERRGRMFERFHRNPEAPIAESAGIGLALVKELVDLHHGTVAVSDTAGGGATFTVRIPAAKEFYAGKGLRVQEPQPDGGAVPADAPSPPLPGANRPDVLVVEDDADLRRFIGETLAPECSVLEASDGDQGLAIARERMPDLVVSDVLMPGLDGFALCARLKEDERTSHIPVVLLTSKAGVDARVQGLETGADDYIAKPFRPRELVARVKNLLEQRRRLRERYRRELAAEPRAVAAVSADEAFLQRAAEAVERNLGRSGYSVEEFAREVGMSKTHLNRKLNALVGSAANEFINTYRLKRAARLLAAKSGNISEVAYEVGFSNPSYFAESFRELFGCSPSEYLKNSPPR